ncbi:hypothetical protein [Streptomyces sp.]|uniref:hypothetical protein n=1 Tax=Streptomyces sp. TaxID=1931 RepID=UPI002F3F57E4
MTRCAGRLRLVEHRTAERPEGAGYPPSVPHAFPSAERAPGESVEGYVGLRSGTAAETVAHRKEPSAAPTHPREVEVRGELSRTATGQILRPEPKALAG